MDLTELNRVLGDEIYRMRSGKAKPERLHAIARVGSVMVRGATVQLEAIKIMGGNAGAASVFGLQKQKALPKKNGVA